MIKQITMAELVSEEKAFQTDASKAKPRSIMKIPQMRLALKETGISYETPQITNRKDLTDFFLQLNHDECFEKFSILAVNARSKPIAIYSILGSISEVSAYPRVVATFALMSNAHSVFFCHNHPGGTCAPSKEDITSTMQLRRILHDLGIMVLDHIIIAEGKSYSMAQHGDVLFTR